VTRPHPPTARFGLTRWLLIVFTLAGFGLLQGGHCAGDLPGMTAMAATSGHPTSVTTVHVAVGAPATSARRPGHAHDRQVADNGHRDAHNPAADDCSMVLTTAVATTVTVVAQLSEGTRTTPAPRHPQPHQHRSLPAVTLAQLGILRT
jgi:hypothetical protein